MGSDTGSILGLLEFVLELIGWIDDHVIHRREAPASANAQEQAPADVVGALGADGFEGDAWREPIYRKMNVKTTEELREIWEQADHRQWSDTDFEVVGYILAQRWGGLPARHAGQAQT